jgi:hypothetical protein
MSASHAQTIAWVVRWNVCGGLSDCPRDLDVELCKPHMFYRLTDPDQDLSDSLSVKVIRKYTDYTVILNSS